MQDIDFLKRTWAVIDLDAIEKNVTEIKTHLKSTKVMAVVKADGYGHGDKQIASALVKTGVDFFAVSNLDEALSLRHSGITADILILGFTPATMADVLYNNNITQTVFSLEYANALNSECECISIKLKVHIKIDTGMTRIGFIQTDLKDCLSDILSVVSLKSLDALGIFSHFSSADSLDSSSIEYTKMQEKRFAEILNRLEDKGVKIPLRHVQNSAGIAFLGCSYEYARAGIVMYGVAPSNEDVPFPITPAMSLKSVVSMVKEVEPNTAVSYGRSFCSTEKMKIATVPIGYADGYPRLLSNKADMLLHGKRARVIGNICMDQLMLDVTDIPDVRSGDLVTVVGRDGENEITFDELSQIVGSISYELMCLIGKRVPRVYKKNGETVAVENYFSEK